MKQIYEQIAILKSILGKQKIDSNVSYRKFFYMTECNVDGGVLLFNTATYEILFLTKEEYDRYLNVDLNDNLVRFLIEEYYLVPEYFDDKKFVINLTDIHTRFQNIYREVPYNFFVILPTTGCNARCFYCFETGAKVSNMTEQTARDVAKFIQNKGADKVKIQWFGGEPLVNYKAIDIICDYLNENNIEFESTMVSNGYLLNEKIIDKAVKNWRLNFVQITLDGTEEIYNKIKNYVYKNGESPYKIVINNIENLLKAGVRVNIRLNMDQHNADDLFVLAEEISDRFSKYEKCHMYVVRLFEETSSEIKNRNVEDTHNLIKRCSELEKYIFQHMSPRPIPDITKAFEFSNHCMAGSDQSVMILPDGHLGKCEHFVDSGYIGSIYNETLDIQKIQEYKETKHITDHCDDCEFFRLCTHLKCCTGARNKCDYFYKNEFISRLQVRLKNIYNKFVEKEN